MLVHAPYALVISGSYIEEDAGELQEEGICFDILPDERTEEVLLKLRRAHALIVSARPITAEFITQAPDLMVIARLGVGVDSVDVDAATRAGIYVTNTPGANAQTVAEFTFGHIISLTRHIHDSWDHFRRGGWRKASFWGPELFGMCLGIIGLGNIGQRVARLGKALEMQVCAFDPYAAPEVFAREGARPVSLEELLRNADILTIHCALTNETLNLIGAKELVQMKSGSYVVNMARGGIVNEEALLHALERGHIAGAALDAYSMEPPTNPRLIQHPRVLATPHIAGLGFRARKAMNAVATRQAIMALKGERPSNAVNDPPSPRNRRSPQR